MHVCATCSSVIREGAKFCTQCGTVVPPRELAPASVPVPEAVPVPVPVTVLEPVPVTVLEPEPESVPEPAPEPSDRHVDANNIPARIPGRGRWAPPPARSKAATWTLVTGLAPFVVSVVGNLAASALGVEAVRRVQAGEEQGAWASVLVVLALVFVLNAGLLATCGVLGTRALRETANGITHGRPLAIAGLAVGGVNLVLWVVGLLSTVSGLDAALS